MKNAQIKALHDLENVKRALDASAIVAITDPEGTIIHVNDKFCDISKYSREELIGENHRVVNSGHHDKQFFAELWKTIRSGNRWEGEIQNRAKDGSTYWVYTNIVPFKNQEGQITEYVSIRFDITEKKLQQQNFSNIVESVYEPILIYDLSGKIIWTNGVGRELVNSKISAENQSEIFINQILGQYFASFALGTVKVRESFGSVLKTLEVTTRGYNYNGHKSYLCVIRDISRIEIEEAQILQQDRLASVGMLASGLAHEIGTPLGIMRGRAELIEVNAKDTEAVTRGAKTIVEQIDRISKLIHSLLGLARGDASAKLQPTNLNNCISEVLELCGHEARKSQIEILFNDEVNYYIQGIHSSLFQVLLNLVVNALHAIQNQQKKNANLKGQIKLTIDDLGESVRLVIADNGCGIPKENTFKIFQPFFTTKDIGVGTGLGLATTYRIINSWGGKVEVESEVDQGTQFKILLRKSTLAL